MTTRLTLLAETKLGDIRGFGPLGNPTDNPFNLLQKLLSSVIGFLTIGAIIWFTLQVIFGAYSWITSSGDPKGVNAAREKILFGIVGLIIVFSALVVISVIGFLLGVDVLNIENSLKTITETMK
ncbi:MAG: hypothetical protein HYU80_00580 [Candidatus Blackburnbacteria bacterium]|nr:hypothetical protein [Candidatus Blackburnbacteria bacterium]